MIPKLSIVIPTRNRLTLLKTVVQGLLNQSYSDFEVIVLDNSDSELRLPLDFFGDNRVRVFPAERTLSMPENWNRGLELVRGDYFAYASDKDFFLPEALRCVVNAIDSVSPDLLCYRKAWYCNQENMLSTYFDDGIVTKESTKPLLDYWFDWIRHLHSAPSVYNSFISVPFLRNVLKKYPEIFVGNSPDVSSGVIFASFHTEYHQLRKSIVIANSGEWSNGYMAAKFGHYNINSVRFLKDFKSDPLERKGLPGTITSSIAEVLVSIKERYPEDFGRYSINWSQYCAYLHEEIGLLNIDQQLKNAEISKVYRIGSVLPFKYKMRNWYRSTVPDQVRRLVHIPYRIVNYFFPTPASFHRPSGGFEWSNDKQSSYLKCDSFEHACALLSLDHV